MEQGRFRCACGRRCCRPHRGCGRYAPDSTAKCSPLLSPDQGEFYGKVVGKDRRLAGPGACNVRSGPELAFHEPESLRGRITKVTKNECAPTGPGTITSNSLRQRDIAFGDRSDGVS
jgi:hypothetical protein